MEEQKIVISDVDRPAYALVQHEGEQKIIFAAVCYDLDPPHPLNDCDSMGRIHHRKMRYHDYDPDWAMLLTGDAVPLSCYEHSGIAWGVQSDLGSGNCHHWGWDGTPLAGVWVPDDELLRWADEQGLTGTERSDWMRERAREACKEYTAWANGWVYGYEIQVYRARFVNGDPDEPGALYDVPSDYRYEDPEWDASCWGFYGGDGLADDLGAALAAYGVKLETIF